MKKFEENRLKLKARLAQGASLTIPGAYDPVSAMLIQRAGFEAVYVGSYATAAARLGQPDVGVVTLSDMAEHAAAVVGAVDLPVLVDAENGWNTAPNVWRTVQAFEKAGAAGIHLEDHEFGKHTSLAPVVASLDSALAKLKAAIAARSDPNFLIIARTDAFYLQKDTEEAIRRLNAFTDAGADLVMAPGLNPKTLAEVRDRIKGKVVITDTPASTCAAEATAGADVVLYYAFTLFAAYAGVRDALRLFRQTGTADAALGVREQVAEFEDFIGYPAFIRRAKDAGFY